MNINGNAQQVRTELAYADNGKGLLVHRDNTSSKRDPLGAHMFCNNSIMQQQHYPNCFKNHVKRIEKQNAIFTYVGAVLQDV